MPPASAIQDRQVRRLIGVSWMTVMHTIPSALSGLKIFGFKLDDDPLHPLIE
jgi:hypothetical protein